MAIVSLVLDQFYHRTFRDLQQINFANSAVLCDSIIQAVSEVRDSWHTLATQAPSPAAAPPQGRAAMDPKAAKDPATAVTAGLTLSV